jgi:two-component system OmpR family response regulator
MRCLLVDDDPAICTLLVDYLNSFGIHTQAVPDGRSLRRKVGAPGAALDVDVVLLDLMLPDDDGLNLCQWLRQVQPHLPVIVLTAQGDPLSRVLGLELGADDYMAKPFEPRELVARIKAVLRRGRVGLAPDRDGPVRFEGWTFDRLRRELCAPDGTVLALSAAEFRLLSAFLAHPGRVLSREQLLDLSRAPGVVVNDRSIDLAVSRLRGKLKDTERERPWIRTLRGVGYLFDVELA